MTYSYRKAITLDRKVVFDLYCLIMREFITEIWGWNEEWQVNDFDNYFIPENITLVYKNNNLVGYSQVEILEEKIHLRMLAIHSMNQGNGIGTELLRLFLSYNQGGNIDTA